MIQKSFLVPQKVIGCGDEPVKSVCVARVYVSFLFADLMRGVDHLPGTGGWRCVVNGGWRADQAGRGSRNRCSVDWTKTSLKSDIESDNGAAHSDTCVLLVLDRYTETCVQVQKHSMGHRRTKTPKMYKLRIQQTHAHVGSHKVLDIRIQILKLRYCSVSLLKCMHMNGITLLSIYLSIYLFAKSL